LADAGRLEVLHDTETIINTYLQILHNANGRWDYFADARSLSLIPSAFEVIKKAQIADGTILQMQDHYH